MANQKEAKVLREKVLNLVACMRGEELDYIGRTSEGVAFQSGEEVIVVRAIVKSEKFDVNEAVEEYERKIQEAKEKAEKAKASKEKKAK